MSQGRPGEGGRPVLHWTGCGWMSSRSGGMFVVPDEGHRPECGHTVLRIRRTARLGG